MINRAGYVIKIVNSKTVCLWLLIKGLIVPIKLCIQSTFNYLSADPNAVYLSADLLYLSADPNASIIIYLYFSCMTLCLEKWIAAIFHWEIV